MRKPTVALLIGSILSAPAIAFPSAPQSYASLAIDLAPDPPRKAGIKLIALNVVIVLAILFGGVSWLLGKRGPKPPESRGD